MTLKSQAHLDTSPLTPLPPKIFPNSLPNGDQVFKPTPSKFTRPQTLMAMSKGKMSVFSPISKHSSLSILHCQEVSKYLLRLNATSYLEYIAIKSKNELCTSSIYDTEYTLSF